MKFRGDAEGEEFMLGFLLSAVITTIFWVVTTYVVWIRWFA